MTPFIPNGPTRYKHQRVGLRRMIESKGVHALLFDPGLGKTAVVLDYASLLALKAPSGEVRVLVTAPLAAVDTWITEAEKYIHPDVEVWAEALGGSIRQRATALSARGGNPLPGKVPKRDGAAVGFRRAHALYLRSDPSEVRPMSGPRSLQAPRLVLCVVNLDSFASRAVSKGSRRTNADLMVEAVRRFQPDLIVVDESHRIKSATSNTSRALARLTPLCNRRVLLTGTVMPHSPLDVYGQWRFLRPDAFGTVQADGTRSHTTFTGFKSRFAVLGGWMGKEVVSFQNLDEMQDVMAENSTVAKKADALDLPPTTDVTVQVDLSPAEQAAYRDMKKQLATMLDDGTLATVPNRLAQMMRLRQITSGFLVDDAGNLRVLGDSKTRVIRSLVQDTLAGEKRIVVFAHFRHEIEQLRQALTISGRTEVLTVTGDTGPEDRALIRKRFGSDEDTRMVLVAQVRTMSLAVNELVSASHAIFASLSLQRDDHIQARDRLDRIGQTKPVTFWNVLAPKSVDQVILTAHHDRTNLEAAMLRHISEEAD